MNRSTMLTDATTEPLRNESGTPEDHLAAMPIEELSINTIRTLAIDAVQAANSGHPGAPMALAPVAYVLSRQMRYNPRNPDWFDRDRFVLSAGHASMLLYSMLHLSGYDLSLEEIKRFRQLGSVTPGHPEVGHTAGVETTTGPLGQGLMNAVGMAMAEAHMAAVFNQADHAVVDHYTYVVCSDGDLMEGASHEAGSLAGHLGLGKLIVVYDDNGITIDGSTDLAWSDDVGARFASYGWHVDDLGDSANDVAGLASALDRARGESEKPSLIIVRSHIGFGSPNKQDSSSAHGSPLGPDEVALTKRAYGWPEDADFLVPSRVREHMEEAVQRGAEHEQSWNDRVDAYRREWPDLADLFAASLDGTPPADWSSSMPSFVPEDGAMATRSASGKALQAAAEQLPWLIGGSADLTPSNNTVLPFSGDFARGSWENRNVKWGVREHVMCSAANGMALHGGVRPYVATFLVFTDYARPAIRLAALMGQPVIYVMTHDSIGLGEDGPTHQPIEHLAALRAIPGLVVVRPADANETSEAWKVAVERTDGPTLLALTRQKVPTLAGTGNGGVAQGAYTVVGEPGSQPDVILVASGSEVSLSVEAADILRDRGVSARVVSLASWELFRNQSPEYRESVFPKSVRARVGVEAGIEMGWREWIGEDGVFIGMRGFGASAPAAQLYEHFGITAAAVVEQALQCIANCEPA
jgi:transketolase